jgi:hypothetical protein
MYLAIHVPRDNAHAENRAGREFTGFLNRNYLDAFMSSILANRIHATIM